MMEKVLSEEQKCQETSVNADQRRKNRMTLVEELKQEWENRLSTEYPTLGYKNRESIISWLLGEEPERLETLPTDQVSIAKQAMDYRWRILKQRYLMTTPERAYRNLIQRLGSLVLLRNKIRTWVALSRDRQRTVVDVLTEVVQEMLHSDRYMQQQIAWIAQCSAEKQMRNALLLANTEEYCLRPIRNQPLLVYRFVNYLRRSQRGGMTQVPAKELVRLVSDEITPDDADNPLSLLDAQASIQYQESQNWEEQQALRQNVQREFENYLAEKVDPQAVRWLQLYLQGRSQEAIAQDLNLPVKQVYRLREKVSYHAIRVFALKTQPEIVANWLETSVQEHQLGLTPGEWQNYWNSLTSDQRQLIEGLKAGKSIEQLARELKLKTSQVMGEWSKLYLAAQAIRSAS